MEKTMKVGEEIPDLIKTAYMHINLDTPNVIHTDEGAQKIGLRGALVGGSILHAYVLEMLYNYFGEKWLYHGKINVAFIGGGAINGDVLTAHGLVTSTEKEEAGTRLNLDVWLETQNQVKVPVGAASCIQ